MTLTRFVFWLLVALAVVQGAVYYPQLPDVVASHFDAAGHADGWMSKPAFMAVHGAVLLLMIVTFAGIPAVRWPDSLVNLPHKEHWLAPERRRATWSYVRRQMDLLGCGTLVLVLAVVQGVIQANLDGSQALPAAATWGVLAAYLVFTAIVVVRMMRHFVRVPPRAEDGGPADAAEPIRPR
jgi:uncharacterized membrane protein